MRASCVCGGGVVTLRVGIYREWRDNHTCVTVVEQEEEEAREVDHKGSSDNQLSHQDNATYDGMKYLPEVTARRIGFQPE